MRAAAAAAAVCVCVCVVAGWREEQRTGGGLRGVVCLVQRRTSHPKPACSLTWLTCPAAPSPLRPAPPAQVILGTQYAGEMKKGVFSLMNYVLPKMGILSLHSGCNEGKDGDVTLFFGLSGGCRGGGSGGRGLEGGRGSSALSVLSGRGPGRPLGAAALGIGLAEALPLASCSSPATLPPRPPPRPSPQAPARPRCLPTLTVHSSGTTSTGGATAACSTLRAAATLRPSASKRWGGGGPAAAQAGHGMAWLGEGGQRGLVAPQHDSQPARHYQPVLPAWLLALSYRGPTLRPTTTTHTTNTHTRPPPPAGERARHLPRHQIWLHPGERGV